MESAQTGGLTIGELLRRQRQAASLTQKELAKLIGYSDTIVSRAETGPHLPKLDYIERFMEALHLTAAHCQELLALYQQASGAKADSLFSLPLPVKHHEDWGEAPDVTVFYGREEELAELRQWISHDCCRVVAVLGMGGIGKTTLATKLAKQIRDEFEYIMWRSLRNAPPLADVLTECIHFLSNQPQPGLPERIDKQISLLIDYLRQHRCLVVLDNAEAILEEKRAGHYREGYEEYGSLIQRAGEAAHQSCLVLTSREKPKELVPLAGITAPVRSMVLTGLKQPASHELLRDRTLRGDEAAWTALTQRYAGNPLALRQVSATIQDLYGGDITTFLEEITTMFGDIRYLLEQQFNRLSELEQEVMYWLAIEREPVSLSELREDLVRPVSPGELLEALEALQRRSLIEKSAGRFTLQNVITEYMTDRLIEQVWAEVISGKITLFQSHALMKAQAKTYVRESQVRLILKPVAERLLAALSQKDAEHRLKNRHYID
jgi:transcriptional regulator with XRE-family HTH domain